MSQINVGCQMTYDVRQRTVFLFQIASGSTSHQQIVQEQLNVSPNVPVENFKAGFDGNRLHRVILQPCQLEISYTATVELTPGVNLPEHVAETIMSEMPPDVLMYLNPSRYCESDLLAQFAFEEFRQLQPGFSRVQAICNWVFEQLDYTPGSTTGTTTAADVLLQRTGVCRDYSHLAITLCRGLGIPARYVAGYAVNLFPPDFHGFFEAYLGGSWYLFDPTRLASVDGLVRIGVGRDAADVSFATLNGDAILTNKSVWANQVTDTQSQGGTPDNLQAVTTA